MAFERFRTKLVFVAFLCFGGIYADAAFVASLRFPLNHARYDPSQRRNCFNTCSKVVEDRGSLRMTTEETEKDASGWEDGPVISDGAPTKIEEKATSSVTSNEPERDMFVPIFALVSLAGLFGAYAFESARLYANGELYLPWNQ